MVKKSLGQISGGTVTINNPSNPDAVSFVAEGVETALSIKDGFKNDHVVATLGKQNIHKIDPDSLKSVVIICADNDGKKSFLDKDHHIRDAAERLKNAGKEVFIALPGDIDNKQKLDFNDLESSEVREAIESALPSDEFNKQADDLQTQDILLEENESNQQEINQEFDQIEQEIF